MDGQIQQYISRIETSKNLPTLPHILVKLIAACRDENGSIQDVSKIISADVSMAAKILKLANSSYFRTSEKISRLDHALVRLGRDAVKNLAISAAIHQVFSKSGMSAGGFDLKRFWRHSLTTAVLSRMIAEKSNYKMPEQAFLAGMIHDIGRLILAANFPDEYKAVLNTAGNESESMLDREIRLMAPHTEIGAWLLKQWKFDSMTIDAALYHHESVSRINESFPLARIVYAANDMSRMTGSNDETYCVLKGLFSGALPDTVEMVLNADDEVQELANLLGLPIGKKETSPPKDDSTDMKIPELVDEVKDLSLLSGVLQDLVSCADENAILAVVQQGLNVLFDVQKVIFFLIDPDDGLLKAKIVNDQAQADSPSGLTLTLQNKDSLIAQSIRKNVMLSSLSSGGQSKPAILDEQIRRLLGSEGIVCLPLIHKGDAAGAIVIGVAAEEEKAVLRQKKLLKFYSTQAGTALYVERLKQTQAGKIAAERLSATTDFARKVVHEANNPLAIIKNYLKILSTRLGAESPVQREFQIIEDEIDRIARILKELSDFSKSRAFTKTVLDLNVLLGDTVRIVSQSLPATFNIKIHTDLSPEVPQIRSDRDALKQIFINLIKNAVEALAGRGNIYVETAYPPAVTEAAHKQGIRGTVRVVIRDDGPGIAPEVEARLFEPYAGTKGNGHSGIGLSVVYNMIKELGGSITYGSAPGKGAVFTITLPDDAS